MRAGAFCDRILPTHRIITDYYISCCRKCQLPRNEGAAGGFHGPIEHCKSARICHLDVILIASDCYSPLKAAFSFQNGGVGEL
jgi:hypothetical protein